MIFTILFFFKINMKVLLSDWIRLNQISSTVWFKKCVLGCLMKRIVIFSLAKSGQGPDIHETLIEREIGLHTSLSSDSLSVSISWISLWLLFSLFQPSMSVLQIGTNHFVGLLCVYRGFLVVISCSLPVWSTYSVFSATGLIDFWIQYEELNNHVYSHILLLPQKKFNLLCY